MLPGIGPAMTIALLLPLTYGLESRRQAFIMFAGIYYGGMYGGSTTSILLNTPGECASVITAIEGNKMAEGRARRAALATAAIGSFIAGTIGTLCLALLAPAIVKLAVKMGAPDYFAVMVLAFIAVTTVLGSSKIRGLAALAIGLLIGSSASTRPRAAAAHAAAPGACRRHRRRRRRGRPVRCRRGVLDRGAPAPTPPTSSRRSRPDDRDDWRRSWKPWLRGTAIGFPFGAIPAGGAEIPTFLSYADGEEADQAPGGVRPRGHRGRGRPRGDEQRLGRR